MAKTIKEEVSPAVLEKLQKDIQSAQVKLSDTMTAINREQLALEEVTTRKEELIGEEVQIAQRVYNLKDEEKDTSDGLKKKREDHKKKSEAMDAEMKELEASIASLKAEKQIEYDNIETAKSEGGKELKAMKDKFTREMKKLQEQIQPLTESITQLKEEKQTLESERASLSSTVAGLRSTQYEVQEDTRLKNETLQSINSELAKAIQTKDNILKEIDSLTGEKELAVQNKEVIENEIEDLQNRKIVLNGEVANREADKAEFVRKSIELTEKEIAFSQREAQLKFKFEQAGLVYP